MSDYKTPTKKKVIIFLLLIILMCMEFPGVFFFKDVADPFIFGFPFIYGYILICWALICIVLFVAYKTDWGEGKLERKDGKEVSGS